MRLKSTVYSHFSSFDHISSCFQQRFSIRINLSHTECSASCYMELSLGNNTNAMRNDFNFEKSKMLSEFALACFEMEVFSDDEDDSFTFGLCGACNAHDRDKR